MTTPNRQKEPGIVYTFYSFKGGVGRTMALANVAALLAEWGRSVLVLDWDLEAPGLERFFTAMKPDVSHARSSTPGILDLIEAKRNGRELDWRKCRIEIGATRLSLISAGRNGQTYSSRLHALDFNDLFENHELGSYIEKLRSEWIAEYDFILVDSRTGFTDIGGICTVHLADVLVLFFTTTESSVTGALTVVERARAAQENLPLDRRRLLAVPVPARDESRTEYENARKWKLKFATRFSDLYRDWLPSAVTPEEAIDLLRLPYVPYWSFGERLPAVEESTSDPASLGHAYEILARLLAARLDWSAAIEGETAVPPPILARSFSEEWLDRHRKAAMAGLAKTGLRGFVETWHFSPDSSISKAQGDLLEAARQARVIEHGWPTGLVLDREDDHPKPLNDGIAAEITLRPDGPIGRRFVYWTLAKNGDFYSLMSMNEDSKGAGDALWFNPWIVRVSEILLHSANLYKALGVEPGAHIELSMRFGGLRARRLQASPSSGREVSELRPSIEDEVTAPQARFALRDLPGRLVPLTRELCEPLFVVFDFATFGEQIYSEIISDFLQRR